MNKTFRVPFENEKGENYYHDLPTREEAEERREELYQEGYAIGEIEEIRI